MPQPNRPPQGSRGGPGHGGRSAPPGRHNVQPSVLPMPEAISQLYRSNRDARLPIHPKYPLLTMVEWYPEWEKTQKGGRDSRSINFHAYAHARRSLNDDRMKAVADAVVRRRRTWLQPLAARGQARILRLTAESDLVIHLSSPGPLELGLALHHVYGFPVLPATSLKGLARARSKRGDVYGQPEHASAVTVLDGFPLKWTAQLDVMTPHFGDWYQKGKAPDDTQGPNPISFLSIATDSEFEVVAIARDGSDFEQVLDLFESDLRRGIDEQGLGAKTAAGYGVFSVARVDVADPESAAPGSTSVPLTAARGVAVPAHAGPAQAPSPSPFERRLAELNAIRLGEVNRLGQFVSWFESLADEAERRQAAKAIVAKVEVKWLKRKAAEDPRWQQIRDMTAG